MVDRDRRCKREKAVVSSLAMIGTRYYFFFILLVFLLTLPTVLFSPCLCFFTPSLAPSQKLLLSPCPEEQLLLLQSWTSDLERSYFPCGAIPRLWSWAEPMCLFSSLSCTPPSGSTPRSRTWHRGRSQASTAVSAHLLLALGLPWMG